MSMSRDDHASARSFLHRWSARKHAAVREAAPPSAEAPPSLSPEPAAAVGSNVRAAAPAPAPLEAEPLPPVESLSFDSDFTAFMRTEVDETTRRSALRKLFSDPRFNVMDGLDVYIDDYSKPDPIAPEIVREMVQARYIFDPPATRVNAQGHVEDVPPEELAALEADEEVPPEELAALKHEEVPLEKLAALKPDAQDVPPEGATAADIGDKGAAPQ